MFKILTFIFILLNISYVLSSEYRWNVYIIPGSSNYKGKFKITGDRINYSSEMIFPKDADFNDIWFCDKNKPYCLEIINENTGYFYYQTNLNSADAECKYEFDLVNKFYGYENSDKGLCPEECKGDDCNTWSPPENVFIMGPP